MWDQGIVIITDNSDRHGYFVDRLIASGMPVRGVIFEAKRRLDAQRPPVRLDDDERVALRLVKGQRREAEASLFEGYADTAKLRLSKGTIWIDRVSEEDGDINNRRFATLLHEAKPALVVVMGAALIKEQLLNLPCLFLNMHTGLSPYYRGGRTNMWPILENDFGYFGVTVHSITTGIDDGEIFASERILTQSGDTYPMINARAIKSGTERLLEVIDRLGRERDWRGTPQWQSGKLFFDRHYNPQVAKAYLERLPAFIDEHGRRQNEGRLAEVRLIAPNT